MDQKPSAIERAFIIARSGHATSVTDILLALHKEHYPTGSLEGPLLRKQLREAIKAAREKEIERG
jgi:hypothetical protein